MIHRTLSAVTLLSLAIGLALPHLKAVAENVEFVQAINVDDSAAPQVAFSADANRLTAIVGGKIVSFAKAADKSQWDREPKEAGENVVLISNLGILAVSDTPNKGLSIFRTNTPARQTLIAQKASILALSADSELMSIQKGGNVEVWRTATGTLKPECVVGEVLATQTHFVNHNRWLLLVEGANSPEHPSLGQTKIVVWDIKENREVKSSLSGHLAGVYHIAYSPNERLLAASFGHKRDQPSLTVFSLDEPTKQRGISRNMAPDDYDLAFSGDGRFLACAGRAFETEEDGVNYEKWKCGFWIVDVKQERLVASNLELGSPPRYITLSNDGTWVATSERNGKVAIWRISQDKK